MIVNIEEVSSIKRKLNVELPAADADKVKGKFLDDYAKKARLKGFRPGKAPKSMVAKIYADELRREVIEDLVSTTVPKALESHNLTPVGLPMLEDVEYEADQPFKFSVVIELKPVFETPQWRGLELEKLKSDISDEKVEKRLNDLRYRFSTIKKIEDARPLAKNDLAMIEYFGFDGDKAIEEMKSGSFNVELGVDRLSPDFEEGLLGMMAGETKDISVLLPKEIADKKLAGKSVTLRTTLHEIKERELPQLDDELAKDLDIEGVETLDQLKEHIKKELTKEADDFADRQFNIQLTKHLAQLTDIEVPSSMVDREVSVKMEGMRNSMGPGADFSKLGVNVGALRDAFRPEAVNSVKAALVLDQIARDNNVEITDEELDKELEEMSKEYSQPVSVLKDYYKNNNMMNNLREGLRISKTLDMIKEAATIKDVEKFSAEVDAEASKEDAPEQAAE